ncbi:HEAT repeat domain-containing protein [Streptomyces sp. NPDC088915]|uniref:HEAT repeat domain-containing protein n=1 Tax=Streptomyces sp. NPDC088915 TaxID=3365912 RepID=UPI00381DA02B
MEGDPLVAAVSSGDECGVRNLLEDGADPDSLDERGTSVLCLAVAAFRSSIAGELASAGADVLRRLDDGSTPLLRAVDSGSVGLVSSLLDVTPLDGAARAELLARAREWHERGPVAVLRERTGSPDPVETVRVRDGEWFTEYHEIRLGGTAVRDGHTGVLTLLEKRFGLRPGVDELAARACALEHPDSGFASWWEITATLAERQDDETWEAAAALRARSDPLYRRFGADVVGFLDTWDQESEDPGPFARRNPEFFLDWAAEEEHPGVLAEILACLGDHEDPRIEPLGLSHLAHPDPRVRLMVPRALERRALGDRGWWTYRTPEGLEAMLTLARDPDAAVRGLVAHHLAESRDPAPAVGDALAGLLDDEEQRTRIWAAFGLAERDDPRCVDGAARVGPVAEEYTEPWSWILYAPDRYEERRREREAATE